MNTYKILNVIAQLYLFLFGYFLLSYGIKALNDPIYLDDDSAGYHVPIAKSIANGTFIDPREYFGLEENIIRYSPGSAEAILSIFLVTGVSINLYNIFGVLALFLGTKKLGNNIGISESLSKILAVCICTLPVISRWSISQFVDIWYAAFYVFFLSLLIKPKKTAYYFLKLGLVAGLVVGSKYSGPPIILITIALFYQYFFKFISKVYFLIFSLFSFLGGGFWYVRNWIITGNPYFPQNLLGFDEGYYINQIWKAILLDPLPMLNAYINEFSIWSFVIIVIPMATIFISVKNKDKIPFVNQLTIIGLFILAISSILPTELHSFTHYISTMRYLIPVVILYILSLIIILVKLKKESLLIPISGLGLLLSSIPYNPKIVLVYLPFGLMLFYGLESIKTMKIKNF